MRLLSLVWKSVTLGSVLVQSVRRTSAFTTHDVVVANLCLLLCPRVKCLHAMIDRINRARPFDPPSMIQLKYKGADAKKTLIDILVRQSGDIEPYCST